MYRPVVQCKHPKIKILMLHKTVTQRVSASAGFPSFEIKLEFDIMITLFVVRHKEIHLYSMLWGALKMFMASRVSLADHCWTLLSRKRFVVSKCIFCVYLNLKNKSLPLILMHYDNCNRLKHKDNTTYVRTPLTCSHKHKIWHSL